MCFKYNFLRRFFCAGFCAALCFTAVTARAEDDVAALLAGRIANDSTLKIRAIELRQAELSQSRTAITNGFNVKLNTGTLFFRFGEDASFEAAPQLSVELPAVNNAEITVSAPLSAGGGEGTEISNTAFTLSADITGGGRKKRTVELLQAERAVTEARRALEKRALEAEKEFYQVLRGLYEEEASLYTKNETHWTEEVEFAQVKAQGYDKSSASYRTALMELVKAEHDALEAERLLRRNIAVFARDCGREEIDALPRSLPSSDRVVSLAGFDRSRYTELESAEWRRHINTLSREADGELTVRAEGGGTFNNTSFQSGGGTHSVNAGLSLSWRGVTLSGGLEFPLGAGGPALKLSLGLDSESIALAPLKKRENALAAQKELIEIGNSIKAWDDLVEETDSKRSDLLWEKNERAEQVELYNELIEDMRVWFEQGIISESEYRKAEAHMESARYNCLITDADLILHQIETSLYIITE